MHPFYAILFLSSKKIKKLHPQKNPLYIGKWNFLPLILKKVRKKKPQNKNPKQIVIFLEAALSSSNIKKNPYIFQKKKLFLYFQKRNPALFIPIPKNKRTPPRENLLFFRKRNPLKIPILGNRNSKKTSYILGGNLQCLKNKEKKVCVQENSCFL